MIRNFILLFFAATHALFAHAFIESTDSRIRTEIYSDQVVYSIYASVGRATLIQFEEDEALSLSASSILGIGDAEAWALGVRGNNLVLKPSKAMPQTNLVVVTNKRTYSIDLRMAAKKLDTTYVLRFRYLDTEAAKLAALNAAEAKKASIEAAKRAEKIVLNTDYSWRGFNKLIAPTAAFDDGRFTKLVYDHAGELPVFYKVLPDGSEALINYNIDPDDRGLVVLHEVIRTVRARMNNDVIEIINNSYKLPSLNRKGTTSAGVSRKQKD